MADRKPDIIYIIRDEDIPLGRGDPPETRDPSIITALFTVSMVASAMALVVDVVAVVVAGFIWVITGWDMALERTAGLGLLLFATTLVAFFIAAFMWTEVEPDGAGSDDVMADIRQSWRVVRRALRR